MEHMRTESDNVAVTEGCYFDAARAERILAWIEGFFCIHLYQWQRYILWLYFGWRNKDGGYRFTKITIFIPKKNGKSWLISALMAYKLFELKAARLFSIAFNATQAKIVMEQVIATFRGSPKIKKLMRPRTGKIKAFCNPFRRDITNEITGTQYIALADNINANDGIIPDVLVFDELHRMKNKQIDVVDGSTSNNPHALKVIISTAGSGDKEHRSWQAYNYAKRVLAGEVVDTQLLPVVYECPDAKKLKGEEIYNLDLLTACNPVLQEIPEKRAQAAKEIEEAKVKRNDTYWRRFRLGEWVAMDGDCYIDGPVYAEAEVPAVDDEALAAATCYIGLDKSGGVWDFHGITALYILEDGRTYERHYTFAGEDRIEDMSERDDMQYAKAVDAGELITIPAEAVADEWLYQWFQATFKGHRIQKIAGDPYGAAYLLERLKADGYDVVAIQQSNNRLLSPVIDDYCQRVIQKKMVHPRNELYTWQLSCARSFTTAKDCKKIVKAGSTVAGRGGVGHIDNVDATLNALAVLRAAEIEEAAYGGSGGAVIG